MTIGSITLRLPRLLPGILVAVAAATLCVSCEFIEPKTDYVVSTSHFIIKNSSSHDIEIFWWNDTYAQTRNDISPLPAPSMPECTELKSGHAATFDYECYSSNGIPGPIHVWFSRIVFDSRLIFVDARNEYEHSLNNSANYVFQLVRENEANYVYTFTDADYDYAAAYAENM